MGSNRDRTEQSVCPRIVDHSVHGLATIRLVAPAESVVRAMIRQLGVSRGEPGRDADIHITFVERFEERPDMRVLELYREPFAFDEENFYLLDGRGYRTRIDFSRFDTRIDLVCERGVEEIPLLTSLLSLSLLRKGHMMLHASAFKYRGKGILVTGWQTGGKSEMLLAFMDAGAYYISDDWTIIRGDDHKMCGLTSDVSMWDWHLQQLPRYRKRIGSSARRRLRLIGIYRLLYHALVRGRVGGGGALALRLLALVDREGARTARVSSSPALLFREQINTEPASIDRVFLANVVQDQLDVVPILPQEIAERMVASQAYERRDLTDAYCKFRFAFPGRGSGGLEAMQAQELLILSKALAGREAYEILHPYPVSLAELYRLAEPFCG